MADHFYYHIYGLTAYVILHANLVYELHWIMYNYEMFVHR